jgi:hypothetical protein
MHWRPIESAPKEHGEQVLLYDACGREMAVAEWLDASRIMDGEEEGFVSGWYLSDGHNEAIWYRHACYVTHWMPLPEPPARTALGTVGGE